jgi:hypothetical protein
VLVIVAANWSDALIEIGLLIKKNIFELTALQSVTGYQVLRAQSISDLVITEQENLFNTDSLPFVVYLTPLLDLKQLQLPEGSILVLDSTIYKSPSIPKTKQFEQIKKTKLDAKLIKEQLSEYLLNHSLNLPSSIISTITKFTNISEILSLIRLYTLIPEKFELYLKQTQAVEETPLFWLQYSEQNLKHHTEIWCKRVTTDEDVAIAVALLTGKIQKSSTTFHSLAMPKLIKLDESIKSSTKKTSSTLFKEMLYSILNS